jgi:hypothetical protein
MREIPKPIGRPPRGYLFKTIQNHVHSFSLPKKSLINGGQTEVEGVELRIAVFLLVLVGGPFLSSLQVEDQVEVGCREGVLGLALVDPASHQGGGYGEVQGEAFFVDHPCAAPAAEAWEVEVDHDSLEEEVLGCHDSCLVHQEDLGSLEEVDLDSWEEVDLGSWQAVDLDSWEEVDLDSLEEEDLDSWEAVDLDS